MYSSGKYIAARTLRKGRMQPEGHSQYIVWTYPQFLCFGGSMGLLLGGRNPQLH